MTDKRPGDVEMAQKSKSIDHMGSVDIQYQRTASDFDEDEAVSGTTTDQDDYKTKDKNEQKEAEDNNVDHNDDGAHPGTIDKYRGTTVDHFLHEGHAKSDMIKFVGQTKYDQIDQDVKDIQHSIFAFDQFRSFSHVSLENINSVEKDEAGVESGQTNVKKNINLVEPKLVPTKSYEDAEKKASFSKMFLEANKDIKVGKLRQHDLGTLDYAGKFFVGYLIGFINNVLTIMFGIKMFQKLPMAIFAVAWESTTADDESLLPFNGADELLLSISGTLFIPTIILVIIVVSYATCIRGTISKYLQLQDKHKKARRKARQQNQSAAIGSGSGDSGGGGNDVGYKPLSSGGIAAEDVELRVRGGKKQQAAQIVDLKSNKTFTLSGRELDDLVDSVRDVAKAKNRFLQIIIFFQLLGGVCLFLGRFGMAISGTLETNTELWLICVGMGGFVVKMIASFIYLQIHLSNEAVDSLEYFKFLIVFYGFSLTEQFTIGLMGHVFLQSWGNFVDVSWRGSTHWISFLSLAVYALCAFITFVTDWSISVYKHTKLQIASEPYRLRYGKEKKRMKCAKFWGPCCTQCCCIGGQVCGELCSKCWTWYDNYQEKQERERQQHQTIAEVNAKSNSNKETATETETEIRNRKGQNKNNNNIKRKTSDDDLEPLRYDETTLSRLSSEVWIHLNSDILRGKGCLKVCRLREKYDWKGDDDDDDDENEDNSELNCCGGLGCRCFQWYKYCQWCKCCKTCFNGIFDVTATTSVVTTLFLMIDFLGSPVSMFRRGYTSTRADHNVVNALLAVMMIMWFGGMLFISKLVRWSLKSVIGFVGFRIVYGIFLVLPLYLYVGERFETRSEMTKEDPDNLKFQEYSVGVTMILSPVLLINLCVGMMRMLIMPHLSLILGLTVGTIISIGLKVGGLAALAILAERRGAFSQGLSLFLFLQICFAFLPMAIKIWINRGCKEDWKDFLRR